MNEFIETKTKALVVLSGGQDSATCVAWAKQRFDEVHAITFDYGQRHSIELESAKKVAAVLEVDSHEIIKVPSDVLKGTSPLVNADAEVDEFQSESDIPSGVAKTFVPVRNQFFLTIAANHAFVKGISVLVTGVCETDYSGYPDCRREFIDALETTLNLGTFTGESWLEGNLKIETPLMYLTKAQSVELAVEEGGYPVLAYTHTAYDGSYPPKGTDAASILRARGFLEADLPDPLILRAYYSGALANLPETSNYTKEAVALAVRALTRSLGDNWYA